MIEVVAVEIVDADTLGTGARHEIEPLAGDGGTGAPIGMSHVPVTPRI